MEGNWSNITAVGEPNFLPARVSVDIAPLRLAEMNVTTLPQLSNYFKRIQLQNAKIHGGLKDRVTLVPCFILIEMMRYREKRKPCYAAFLARVEA